VVGVNRFSVFLERCELRSLQMVLRAMKWVSLLTPVLAAIAWTVWVTLAHAWNSDTAVVGGLLYVITFAYALGWFEFYYKMR
jgi:hypothetical protein